MARFLFYGWITFHFLCVCVCVCIPHLLYPCIYLWNLAYFHVLVIINNAVMNIGVHVSFHVSVSVSLTVTPRCETAESMRLLFCDCTSLQPHQQSSRAPFPPYHFHPLILLDDTHSDGCEVVTHCGLYLHCPDD